MSEKWTANDVVCYGSAGILLTILLYVILAFAPSLMVSISIADTLAGWPVTKTGTKTITITHPPEKDYTSTKGFIECLQVAYPETWEEELIKSEEKLKKGYAETKEISRLDSLSWGLIWGVSFGALIIIQLTLQANIRSTWGIIIPWWLLSLYPFFDWFYYFYMNEPFTGVNWFPFF